MNLKNQWVKFRINDVYLPEPQDLLSELHGEDFVTGRVVDVSDSGKAGGIFAVIEMKGTERPLLVPVDHVTVVEPLRKKA